MRFNFKKISAVAISTLLTGMSMGVAAAASYPAPFVSGGVANTAVVYGTGQGVASTDSAKAGDILTNLQTYITSTGGTTTVSGESATLDSGTDYIYLNDELNENIQTITKDDLSNTLADGTFTDDGGTDYDFEQTIAILAGGVFAFGNSDNDLDDPALTIDLTTAVATGLYNLTVTFDDPVNFTDSESEGETIVLFGKSYTVGTATDATTLILLGGSDAQTLQIGETATLTAGDESYEVTLNGVSDAATPAASISINGETKTFTEGQTKSFSGGDVDVFVKTIFRTGENSGHIELQLGADKLTFESGNEVLSGSDDDEIDGTKVYISGTVVAMTKLVIAVAAEDNDVNHLLVGDSFIDPVFGSVKISFASVRNAPVLEGENDVSTDRTELAIEKGGNRELMVSATDKNGNAKTLPFTYQNNTADDSGGTIHLWEGASIAEDDYFILNSGTKQHFMQMTQVSLTATTGSLTDDIGFKDLFTGNTYSIDNKNFTVSGGQDITIAGQTYTVTQVSGTAVTVTSSDYSSNIAVYPYIELVANKDHKFAYTDNVTLSAATPVAGGMIYELPTGNIRFFFSDNTTTSVGTYKIDGGSSTAIAAALDTYTIGSVDYVIATTVVANVSLTVNNITIEAAQSATGDAAYTAPALLFVEDDDKAESTTTTQNAVLLKTHDTETYSTVLTPILTATQDTESFDDSDFVGYIDTFGTYVLHDSSDTNQDFASLTYSKDAMSAEVLVVESGAVISSGGTTSGAVMVTDAEISDVSSKNLIIVGGSCINSAAAKVLGFSGPACGAAFTAKTNVGAGQYLIKSVSGAYASGKLALVVAGYEAAETANAVEYLINKKPDTSKEWKGTTATVAEEVVTVA